MSRWLYQMNEDIYTFKEYQNDIREGKVITWPTKKVMFSDKPPGPGDILFCFYAEMVSKYPGICGFGIIIKYPDSVLTKKYCWDNPI